MRDIIMCEVLERKDQKHKLDYDREEPEDITKSLMILSERSLHEFLASEPDIYTVDDLKVRDSDTFLVQIPTCLQESCGRRR